LVERRNVMKVRKAVFPVAGFGARFLPATKAMPKELLPIVDKPLIQYAAEEAIAAGIDTLIFVTGRNKRAIEDHFDANNELETILRAKGRDAQADMVRNIIPEGFQVKRIHVKPGAALSLQSHERRSEHWIVVEGTARVTIADTVQTMTEGQSVYVPLGARHRLENPGDLPMVLIEVQIGSYLGEDDIVRYEDLYARK
jgi:UTP-glucose-1-phosphate uridylyltransferase